MIYLDNAATTFPKPPEVAAEVARSISEYGGNAGHGAHALALAAARKIYACREAASAFFDLGAPERVVFTQNTTHALNLALSGVFGIGDHILISELEHNAVRRPVLALAQKGLVSVETFPVLGLDDDAILEGLRARIRPDTRAVVCLHASNIVSAVLPIEKIGALTHRHGLFFIVDAAQSAGLYPISMRRAHIDALAVPAHKGLYGIQGCGALLLGERLSPEPLLYGGTGAASLPAGMPHDLPERYEAGTLPLPAVAGLLAAFEVLEKIDLAALAEKERALFVSARDAIGEMPAFHVFAPEREGGVLLFAARGHSAPEVARFLDQKGICVRAGLHCAPMAHKALGTPEDGAVRVSFGRYNTERDVRALLDALREIH